MFIRRSVLVGLVTLCFATCRIASAQTTWYVDDDCPQPPGTGSQGDPFCTIGDAISSSSTTLIDTILVLPGTYNEVVHFFQHPAALKSRDGPDVTTIVGAVVNPKTLVEGLTITGSESGIICDRTSPLITHNIITGNTAGPLSGSVGGGISLAGSSARIIDNVISNNTADVGGGIRISRSGNDPAGVANTVKIVRCLIEGNGALFGGAGVSVNVPVSDFGVFWMVNCTVRNNTVTGQFPIARGGGILLESGGLASTLGGTTAVKLRLILQNCLVSCNTAHDGAGLFVLRGPGPAGTVVGEIINSTITGNEAHDVPREPAEGGGITVWSATVQVHNSILWNDTATLGPELVVKNSGNLTVSHSIIQGGCANVDIQNGVLQCNAIDADPLFVDPLGPDLVVCTDDDDYRPTINSPAIDAGDNSKVKEDFTDLDDDMNIIEPTPFDRRGFLRFADEPSVVDTGWGQPPVVDMGPYEFSRPMEVPTVSEFGIVSMATVFVAVGILVIFRRHNHSSLRSRL